MRYCRTSNPSTFGSSLDPTSKVPFSVIICPPHVSQILIITLLHFSLLEVILLPEQLNSMLENLKTVPYFLRRYAELRDDKLILIFYDMNQLDKATSTRETARLVLFNMYKGIPLITITCRSHVKLL